MKLKLLNKILITSLMLLSILSIGFAQRSIQGTLTDEQTGEALIGANILIVGTSTGTITDFDGTYTLDVPEGQNLLEISYTGYATQRIDLSKYPSNTIDLQLSAGELLDEVVVIGYGTVKKEDATGAIQTVNSDVFNKGAITSPQDLLAGKVAGVQITNNGGAPGEGAVIRIRGGSSLSASNDPLVVIDGIPVDNGSISGARNVLNFINPNDIETFTVLKDASATAIYGSRASNGVILITTKKGSLETNMSINYTGNVSISRRATEIEVLSGDEFRALINDRFEEGHPARALLGTENTDWQDEIFETAFGHDHNLSLSGGIAEVLPYRLSLGYTDKKGILKTDEFQRTTASLNLSPGFMDNRLQVNLNTKASFTDNRFADRGAIGSALEFDPTKSVLDAASPYEGYYTWVQNNGQPNTLAPGNPLALLNLTKDVSDVTRFITNASIDYRFKFLPALRANLNLGYDYSKGKGTKNIPATAAFAFDTANGGGVNNKYEQTKKNELLEFYLNYNKELGKSKLELMGGYSWQRFFFEDSSLDSDIAGTPSETIAKNNSGELFLLSLFGRANYSIDRFLFTFTLRRDGSSRFSPDSRWGLFPAAALGVKIVDRKEGILNNLKLRVGYGKTGQQDIGGFYEYLSLYTKSTDNAQYQLGDEFVTTLRPEEYDANIKWEETATYNVGLDYDLFNNRVYGALEYYFRKTKDLLNRIPVPAGSNLSNRINTNVGNLENQGVEFSVNVVPVQKENVTWDVGFNVSFNNNEITRLTAVNDPAYQGVEVGGIAGGVGNNIQIHSVGFPANSFYVFEQVYDNNGVPIEGLYVDRNGDGQVTPDDRYRFEKPAPDAFFGLTSSLSYGNFDFSFAGRANVGNYVYNNIQSNQAFYNKLYNSTNFISNVHVDTRAIDFSVPQYFSDYFIQEASFFRIDHITAGYRFDKLLKGINGLKVYVTIQNPILVTDYKGLDPEIGSANRPGIDSNIYPRTRTFLFGVNANF